MNELGELVRSYRKSEGLTQEELAEKVGKSVTTISRIENDAPVGPHSREVVLRELGIPVFCSVYSVEYSKVIEIKREMLTALYFEDIDWYISAYGEYQNYHELNGVMGEMYSDYFKIMYDFFACGDSIKLNEGLMQALSRIVPIDSTYFDLKSYEDYKCYKCIIRRIMRENKSEIDVLLINGIAGSLVLQGKYERAKIIFEELIKESRRKEMVFDEKHSYVPTLCYNLALCLLFDGKNQESRDILESIENFYIFRDDMRLELKYKELLELTSPWEKELHHLTPIFSFPKQNYWYAFSNEVKI